MKNEYMYSQVSMSTNPSRIREEYSERKNRMLRDGTLFRAQIVSQFDIVKKSTDTSYNHDNYTWTIL